MKKQLLRRLEENEIAHHGNLDAFEDNKAEIKRVMEIAAPDTLEKEWELESALVDLIINCR